MMSTQHSSADTWVIFEVRTKEFAVAANHVREILMMPDIAAVPMCHSQNRGVIDLRGQILPLIDTRKHFGWPSVPEELEDFYKLMNQREQDHRRWLAELDRSVTEGAEFRLATDPHKCAFGQWYDAYRSESPWITSLLRKFDAPHRNIHAIALVALELVKDGKREQASRLIEQKRNGELREMAALFAELKKLTRESVKELAMVIATTRNTFAVSIDRAIAVEAIPPHLIKDVQADRVSRGCGLVRRVAERTAAKSLAMILEPAMFGF